MPRRLAALGLGCGIALVILYSGELALRISATDPGLQAIALAEAAGRPFDPRTRRQVVSDLRARGRDAVPRLVPAGLLEEDSDGALRSRLSHEGRELLPLAGIASHTTVLCAETGEWALYESDQHGFRNPTASWKSTPVDVVLLGDSFTIGECVRPGENIADRLRDEIPRTVNLGYSGNSPLLELATLAEYGERLRPRVTLWLYFENDLSWFDLGRSRRAPLLMRYLEGELQPVQGLADLQPAIDAGLTALLEADIAQLDDASLLGRLAEIENEPETGKALRGFVTLRSLRALLPGLHRARTAREPQDYALFTRVLERARSWVESWDGELVVVYLPGAWNFDAASRGPAFAHPAAREEVGRIAASLGLGFVDAHASVAAHPDPLSLYSYRGDSVLGSPHLNADGYARVAELLGEALRDQLSARRSQISRQ